MMRNMAAITAGAALAVTAIACDRAADVETRQEPVGIPETETTGVGTTGAGAMSVADVQEDPARFIGGTITIEGEVDRVVGPYAFFLDEEAPLRAGLDNDLLILTRDTGETAAAARADDQWIDERVQVTGSVQVMSTVEVEREVGWDLDPQIEAELEGVEAVVIADSVQRGRR